MKIHKPPISIGKKDGSCALLSGLVLLILLGLFGTSLPARAAVNGNLLKGLNPSFEAGITNWLWNNGGTFPPNFSIINGTASEHCGDRVLKIQKSDVTPRLGSPRVEIPMAGRYRFSIWLRVKRTPSQDASIEKLLIVLQSEFVVRRYRIPINQNYTSRWVKHSRTIYLDTPWQHAGLDIIWRNSFGGSIFVDCAKIQKLR